MVSVLENPVASKEMSALGRAVLNIGDELDISQVRLAEVLGISQPSVSRLKNPVDPFVLSGKPAEMALLLLRIYRSLDSILDDSNYEKRWFKSFNKGLQGTPADLITSAEGMVRVLSYLDANRAGI